VEAGLLIDLSGWREATPAVRAGAVLLIQDIEEAEPAHRGKCVVTWHRNNNGGSSASVYITSIGCEEEVQSSYFSAEWVGVIEPFPVCQGPVLLTSETVSPVGQVKRYLRIPYPVMLWTIESISQSTIMKRTKVSSPHLTRRRDLAYGLSIGGRLSSSNLV
jgi:hypothetical protein